MKRFLPIAILSLMLFIPFNGKAQSQSNDGVKLYKQSWSLEFGGSWPRFFSSDLRPREANFGGFVGIKRSFTENFSLRFSGKYNYITGMIPGNTYLYEDGRGIIPSNEEEVYSSVAHGNLELMYDLLPCSNINPYIGFGGGVVYYEPVWEVAQLPSAGSDYPTLVFQFALSFGTEFKMSQNWSFLTEINYYNIDSKIDGIVNNNRQGLFGSNADSYINFDLGFAYNFGHKGESKMCMPTGISMDDFEKYATKDEIEQIVKENLPEIIEKEVVVEKPVKMEKKEDWILVGVNFATDKAELRPESYEALFNNVMIMKRNPDLKVEIQGHTDNVGSKEYNEKLSLERAKAVKEYFVMRGIDPDRLIVKGYGESMPIASNDTEQGRAKNRRIELKVLNK